MSAIDADDMILGAVLTVGECAIMYNKTVKTVHLAILRGRLSARQSSVGATWIISRASATRLWGQPRKDLNIWQPTDQ